MVYFFGMPYRVNEEFKRKLKENDTGVKGFKDTLTSLAMVVGIITAIAPQHLQKFGSLENIAKAKLELIENLKKDGIATKINRCIRAKWK